MRVSNSRIQVLFVTTNRLFSGKGKWTFFVKYNVHPSRKRSFRL